MYVCMYVCMYFKVMHPTRTHDPKIKNLFQLSQPGPPLGDVFINVCLCVVVNQV